MLALSKFDSNTSDGVAPCTSRSDKASVFMFQRIGTAEHDVSANLAVVKSTPLSLWWRSGSNDAFGYELSFSMLQQRARLAPEQAPTTADVNRMIACPTPQLNYMASRR